MFIIFSSFSGKSILPCQGSGKPGSDDEDDDCRPRCCCDCCFSKRDDSEPAWPLPPLALCQGAGVVFSASSSHHGCCCCCCCSCCWSSPPATRKSVTPNAREVKTQEGQHQGGTNTPEDGTRVCTCLDVPTGSKKSCFQMRRHKQNRL